MKQAKWMLAMAAGLSVVVACADYPGGPAPRNGTLVLRLTTPQADDGALLFEVRGPAIDSMTAVKASLRLFTRQPDGATIVAAVVGPVDNGVVATLHVPDISAGGYTARVIEVADRADALRASLVGYAIRVDR